MKNGALEYHIIFFNKDISKNTGISLYDLIDPLNKVL